MSAFVIDASTMGRVVRGICASTDHGQLLRTFLDISTTDRSAACKIGRKLFALNIEAVMQRYPDTRRNPSDLPGPCQDGKSTAQSSAATFIYPGPNLSSRALLSDWVETFKAMQCLSYQCSEGDIPERDEFKQLQAAIGEVAQYIVMKLPAYEAASWG